MGSPAPLDHLEILRRQYASRLPGSIAQMRRIADHWNDGDDEPLRAILRLAHKLRGSGAIYGFETISDTAAKIENAVQKFLKHRAIPSPARRMELERLMSALTEAARVSCDAGTPPAPDRRAASGAAALRPVYLLEGDPNLAREMTQRLGDAGYAVRAFADTASLRAAVRGAPPAALILDMLPGTDRRAADAAFVAALQRESPRPLPLLFICARDDLAARLEALRAGGQLYVTRPMDPAALVEKLDILTGHTIADPYRVLVVDDDAAAAAGVAAMLERAGMRAEVVTAPLAAIDRLVEFAPDVVLLDLYMPACSGPELARIIRQEDGYAAVPIVFLSIEDDPDKQLAAIVAGGDEFLVKSASPTRLVASVGLRAQRARFLRAASGKDGLTGLLTRGRLQERLDVEMARAERAKASLAFAILDIDGFRQVNAESGHLAGDGLLRKLARLLSYRLRRSDVAGRWGGDEIGVVLCDAGGREAARVLAEVREVFARARASAHDDGKRPPASSAAFRCGIAAFPSRSDAAALRDEAEAALRRAQASGTELIVVADD